MLNNVKTVFVAMVIAIAVILGTTKDVSANEAEYDVLRVEFKTKMYCYTAYDTILTDYLEEIIEIKGEDVVIEMITKSKSMFSEALDIVTKPLYSTSDWNPIWKKRLQNNTLLWQGEAMDEGFSIVSVVRAMGLETTLNNLKNMCENTSE